jgi:quercetin dioxygenase-like cupin family protein
MTLPLSWSPSMYRVWSISAWRASLLAQPVKDGSIHRARLSRGTLIPVHTHPADEYVMVLGGTVETGGRRCEAGTFWIPPAGARQGPYVAITDVELLTVRLGAMGSFGE